MPAQPNGPWRPLRPGAAGSEVSSASVSPAVPGSKEPREWEVPAGLPAV